MKSFFYTIFDVPVSKRKAFKDIEIFWNSISRNKTGRYLSRILKKRRYLSIDNYSEMMRKTKIYINTLSPMGLISPRFFECMASQSLVFCEESELYQNIFTDDLYVTYKKDLSDFRENLLKILSDQSMRNEITNKAYKYVHANHTWKERVSLLLNKISPDSSSKIFKAADKKENYKLKIT
jgi:spore maturation protein CgeB